MNTIELRTDTNLDRIITIPDFSVSIYKINMLRSVTMSLSSSLLKRIGITITLLLLFLVVTSTFHLPLAQAVSPPISVTTTDVVDDGNDGQCDLYEALQAAFSQKSSGDPSFTYHECTAQAGPKIIVFEGAAAGGTISMPTGSGSLNLPMINDDVTIIGPVLLDGAGEKRIFSVAASGTLTLEGMTIQNGYTSGGGGAILSSQGGSINIIGSSFLGNKADNDGGAINTSGDLSILTSNFTGNEAGREGGAIYQASSHKSLQISVSTFNGNSAVKAGGATYIKTNNAEISDSTFNGNMELDNNPNNDTHGGGAIYMDGAELTIERSAFNGNLALDGNGGAIATSLGTELVIEDSSFNGNISGDLSSTHLGGALYNMETLTIRGVTFLNNLSSNGDGGAIFNDKGAELDAANTTFSANGAPNGDGGALYNGNTQQGSNIASHATFRNVTLYANLAGNDGSTFFNQDGNHTISLGNTIVDDGSGPVDNCNRTLTSLGHNLDTGSSCGLNGSGDLENGDADLEFLSFNGGPLASLFTHLPGENSDAIDAGDNTICNNAPVDNKDQTGGLRPKDGDANGVPTCDIGSVEADARIPGYGSTPIQPGPLNIGTTTVNIPVTNILKVFETGNATLTVSNPTFGGPNAGEFELVSPFTSFDISDGDASVDLGIRCTPTAEGLRTATFTLNTNDPVHPVVTYDLECSGQLAPTPGFGSTPAVPGPLDFGQRKVDDSTVRTLKIFETGNDTLTFGNAGLSGPNPDDFTFNAFPTSIPDGGADVNIPITCTPSGIGLRSATLSMTTNDPVNPTVSWNLVCEGTPPPSPLFESVGQSVTTPVNVLDGVYGVDVSPDGKHLYATAFLDDQVLHFDRDFISGELTYYAAYTNPSTNGPQLIAVSPDGEQVYVTNGLAGTLVVYERNPTSGILSFTQALDDSNYPDLLGAYGVAVSPNGRFIYVTSVIQHAIIGFERLEDDILVYRFANSDSSNVDLIQARNLTISPDGLHLYVTAQPTSDGEEGNILVYNIDPLTGAITHEQTIHEGDLIGPGPYFFILDGLGGAFDVVVSPDGGDVYVVGTYDGTVVNFIRDAVNGRLTYNGQLRDGQSGVDGLDGVSGVDITPDGNHVATTAFNDNAVAVFVRDPVNGRLSQIQVIARDPNPPYNPLLQGARDIDISPDGTGVYAAAFLDDAIVGLHVINPRPVVETLAPASATVGSSGLTLSVTGQDFLPGVTAIVNGSSRPANYVNSTTMEVFLNATDLAAAGNILIGAANPAPGGGSATQEIPFTVTAVNENPVPTIEALLPGGVAAGGNEDVTITVQGVNFIPASVIQWNGVDRTTEFINNSTLLVTIPGSELSAVGTAVVTVFNPTPGGGTSNPAGFSITYPWYNPTPTILSVHPDEISQIGILGKGTTVNIQGSDFIEDSQAQWNGENRPTQYISETELVITLTAVDMTQDGIGVITVHNPLPGGGTSNPYSIKITRFRYGNFLPLVSR
jgi:predicted outer membrane repeat protein